MKKLLSTLAIFTAAALSLTAQERKLWDFSAGLSDADRMNLDADANWNNNNVSDDGVTQYWNDATKLSGRLSANGVELEYTGGLTVGTAGLSKNNNFKIGPSAFRMTRNGMTLSLPNLVNGQTVTIQARSANATATDRGIKGNDNMNYISGPAGGICLGNQVEGSEGTYTLVWQVQTDETDSVPVMITMITGGIDIASIMIDDGRGGGQSDMDEINIAYLYDSSYNGAKDASKNPCGWLQNGGLDTDPIYAALQTYNVTAIDYNGQTLTSAELNDSLMKFSVVVAGECVSSGNALAKGLLDIVNKVPMLNLKSFMYKSGVWSWGAGVNPSPKAVSVTIAEDYLEDPLFADVELDDEGNMPLFECEDVTGLNGNLVQGYTALETAPIAADEVLATVGDGTNAIHRHGQKNQYLLLPLSSDNMDLVHGNVYVIIDNAVKLLAATKSNVLPAGKPSATVAYADGETTVTLKSSIPGATIHYTVDGTEPTAASAVYSEPLVFTQTATLKAFVIAAGYFDSEVLEQAIEIKSVCPAPEISVDGIDGMTTIFLSAEEGANIYYSFNGIKEASNAALYLEPVVITEPATITFFAQSTSKLPSELVSSDIPVGGIPAVKDTVAHFTANEEAWFTNAVIKDANLEDQPVPESNWAAKAAYYWGKSAWSCYSDEVDHTEPVLDADGNQLKDINGNDSIKTIYKLDPQAVKYVYSNTDTQWRLRSQGQLFTGECNVKPELTIGGPDKTGYFAETAQDLIGQPTTGKMTFGGKASGEPYNASIESTQKFQAPFDVVTYTTNGGGSAFDIEIQTSADGENWTAVGKLPVAGTQRYYKKDRCHVSETDELYVRLIQVGGSTKAQVYDILIVTTEGTTGIETIHEDCNSSIATRNLFDLYGRQLTAPVRGQLYIQGGQKIIIRH